MNSVCAYCGVGCEIDVEVKNNKITKVLAVKDGLSSGGGVMYKREIWI